MSAPPAEDVVAEGLSALKAVNAGIYNTAWHAEQMWPVDEIVAYWCTFWVFQQILTKNLHHANDSIGKYASHLITMLEEFKDKVKDTDRAALVDENDHRSGAHVAEFATKRLHSAEDAVFGKRATKLTADKFTAAAIFLNVVLKMPSRQANPEAQDIEAELENSDEAAIDGDPRTTKQKLVWAVKEAGRIRRALQEGRDPNATEATPEELSPRAGVVLPDVGGPGPVTIEDEAEGNDGGDNPELRPSSRVTRRDSAGVSLPHSRAVSETSNRGGMGSAPTPEPPSMPSFGLPTVPPAAPATSDIPHGFPPVAPTFNAPTFSAPTFDAPAAPDMYYQTSPPQQQPQQPQQPPTPTHYQQPAVPPTFAPSRAPAYAPAHAPAPAPAPAASSAPYQPSAPVDEVAMVSAQKHAKWAISALNFEDVQTAVRELQRALEFLGAS